MPNVWQDGSAPLQFYRRETSGSGGLDAHRSQKKERKEIEEEAASTIEHKV